MLAGGLSGRTPDSRAGTGDAVPRRPDAACCMLALAHRMLRRREAAGAKRRRLARRRFRTAAADKHAGRLQHHAEGLGPGCCFVKG